MPITTVYVLKDDLKQLWRHRYPGAASRFRDDWYARAVRSHIGPLVGFAKRLKSYLPGILAHCRWQLHTSLVEGINNKIKGDQTNGIRPPGRRLLPPQHPRGVPRDPRMNRFSKTTPEASQHGMVRRAVE